MANGAPDTMAGRSPPPRSRSTTTVLSPSARTPSVSMSVDCPERSARTPTTSAMSEASGDGSRGSKSRRQLWTTSAAVNGDPSLNVRSGRRLEGHSTSTVFHRPGLREGGADGQGRVDGGQRLVELADVRRTAEVPVARGIQRGRGPGDDPDRAGVGSGCGRHRPRSLRPEPDQHGRGQAERHGRAGEPAPVATAGPPGPRRSAQPPPRPLRQSRIPTPRVQHALHRDRDPGTRAPRVAIAGEPGQQGHDAEPATHGRSIRARARRPLRAPPAAVPDENMRPRVPHRRGNDAVCEASATGNEAGREALGHGRGDFAGWPWVRRPGRATGEGPTPRSPPPSRRRAGRVARRSASGRGSSSSSSSRSRSSSGRLDQSRCA